MNLKTSAVARDGDFKPIAVTPKSAFAAIEVGATKGYELINAGELETFKIGRSTRVTTASIEAFVARQLEQAQAA